MNPLRILKSPAFFPNVRYHIIVWTLAGIFFLFLRLGTLDESIFGELSVVNIAIFLTPIGIIAGLIFGTITTYIERFVLYRKSFRQLITLYVLIYIFGFVLFLALNFLRLIVISPDRFDIYAFPAYITDINSIIFMVYMTIVSFFFTMLRQIDKKMGSGTMWRLIRGEFYEPKEVMRTFMFLDLRSSTTIAEKLGNIRYSKFLQDCFYELSNISCYHAEIYQFVGDEVVLTWPIKDKKLIKMDVVRTYFAFNERLQARKDYFMKTYGVVPVFKAGIHSGIVTLAEVGNVKRDMAYHGDTINTAARLQEKCNEYKVNLLISRAAMDLLTPNDKFDFRSLGPLKLRDRKEELEVFTV